MCNFLSGHIVADTASADWGKVLVVTGIHHEVDREDPRVAKYDGELAAWETYMPGTFEDGFHITHGFHNSAKITKENRRALCEVLEDWAKDRLIEKMPGYKNWKNQEWANRLYNAKGAALRAERALKVSPVKRWLDQKRHGKTGLLGWKRGNVSYVDRTIYSYGWWPMATLVGDDAVLIRDERYSVSTSRHQGAVRHAVHARGFAHVFNVTSLGDGITHNTNLTHYEDRIGEFLDKADRARVARDCYMKIAAQWLAEMGEYIEYFELGGIENRA